MSLMTSVRGASPSSPQHPPRGSPSPSPSSPQFLSCDHVPRSSYGSIHADEHGRGPAGRVQHTQPGSLQNEAKIQPHQRVSVPSMKANYGHGDFTDSVTSGYNNFVNSVSENSASVNSIECDVSTLSTDPVQNGLSTGHVNSVQPRVRLPNKPSPHDDITDDAGEDRPLLGDDVQSAVYGRRWYVLAVFSLAAALQGLGWGTWGPITQSAKAVFSWSDGTVALQPLWGNLAATLAQIPIIWLMDVKGLRIAMLVSVLFLSAGFGLRCITSDPNIATWLINVGQTLIGVGGTFPFSGVSLVAATWFPPNQRATATSIASVFGYVGVAASFIVGPEIVPAPPNVTSVVQSRNSDAPILNATNMTDAFDLTHQSEDIMRLMYYEAGAMGVLLLLVLVYFPARPPRPPSRTAAMPRTEFSKGLQALLRNKRFCLLAIAYCLPVGAYGGFGGIMDIDLNPAGITQTTAGWIGFYSTVGGCVSGLVFSRVADMFMRRLKLLLVLLSTGAALSCSWFCLLVLKYIPFHLPSVYASSVLIGVFINGSVPLFYEAACEVSYPVAEGVTTGLLALLNNVVGIAFFALLLVPGIGVVWMNWALLGTVLIAIPILLTLKQHYARIDIDTEIDVPEPGLNTTPDDPLNKSQE